MPVQIDTPSASYSTQTVTLNKKSYTVEFKYNTSFGYWSLSVYDAENKVVLLGEKVMPAKEYLERYSKGDVMGGYLYITSLTKDDVSRDNFGLNKTHVLTFETYEERGNGTVST